MLCSESRVRVDKIHASANIDAKIASGKRDDSDDGNNPMHTVFRGPSEPKQADKDSQCTKHSVPQPYFWSHLSRTSSPFSLVHKPIKCNHSRHGKCATKSDSEKHQPSVTSIKTIYRPNT